MQTKPKLLAIDLDGTLIDTAPDLAYCLGHALESLGIAAPDTTQAREWIGDGIEVLVERGLTAMAPDRVDAETRSAALTAFTRCYEQNLFVRSRLYPEVLETLDDVRQQGCALVCITNKRLAFSEEILRLAGIRDRFELVFGGDSCSEKKPAPAQLIAAAEALRMPVSQCVLVGDSYHDYHAARAAAFEFIWAAYGYCDSIDAAETLIYIDRFSDLAARINA